MTYSLLWLPDVLRKAGLQVVEVVGWQNRGHGDEGKVLGILCHHTCGPLHGDIADLNVLVDGRPDLGGPLCNIGLGRSGVFQMIAAGKGWHAGAGNWQGVTDGNSHFVGIEAENTGETTGPRADVWPEVQMDAYRRACAAILKHIGAQPIMCAGHKEYALPRGRKDDPDFDMVKFRSDVAAIMAGAAVAVPSLVKPAAAAPAIIANVTAKPSTILQYVQAHGPIAKGQEGLQVKQVQAALLRDGRELVPDGDFGGITTTAVEKFQTDHNLQPLGYVGVKTAAALDAVPVTSSASIAIAKALPSVLKVAPWLSAMRAMNGLHEAAGAADNPVIISWPREIAAKYPDLGPDVLWYNHDSIAWCGLAAGICATRGGEKPPKGLLGAGNWASFGQKMSLSDRTPGAIFVYSRVGGHHVTMYESEDATYYYCRGGNQSDGICVTRIPKTRAVLAVRWGNNFPIPKTGPVHGATANAMIASEA